MATKTDSEAVSIDDHLALQAQVDELKAALAKVQAHPAPAIVSTTPNGEHDLYTYTEGEFAQRGTGDKLKLKVVNDDPHGRKFHLKNKAKFFHAATVAELREHFDGDFSKFEPKPDPKK